MKERRCYWAEDPLVLDVRKRKRFRIAERVYFDGDVSMGHPIKDRRGIVLGFSRMRDVHGGRMVKVYLEQSQRILLLSPDWLRRW